MTITLAFFGIGTADAGLTIFFSPIKVDQNADYNNENDCDYNKIFHNYLASANSALRLLFV